MPFRTHFPPLRNKQFDPSQIHRFVSEDMLLGEDKDFEVGTG